MLGRGFNSLVVTAGPAGPATTSLLTTTGGCTSACAGTSSTPAATATATAATPATAATCYGITCGMVCVVGITLRQMCVEGIEHFLKRISILVQAGVGIKPMVHGDPSMCVRHGIVNVVCLANDKGAAIEHVCVDIVFASGAMSLVFQGVDRDNRLIHILGVGGLEYEGGAIADRFNAQVALRIGCGRLTATIVTAASAAATARHFSRRCCEYKQGGCV